MLRRSSAARQLQLSATLDVRDAGRGVGVGKRHSEIQNGGLGSRSNSPLSGIGFGSCKAYDRGKTSRKNEEAADPADNRASSNLLDLTGVRPAIFLVSALPVLSRVQEQQRSQGQWFARVQFDP